MPMGGNFLACTTEANLEKKYLDGIKEGKRLACTATQAACPHCDNGFLNRGRGVYDECQVCKKATAAISTAKAP